MVMFINTSRVPPGMLNNRPVSPIGNTENLAVLSGVTGPIRRRLQPAGILFRSSRGGNYEAAAETSHQSVPSLIEAGWRNYVLANRCYHF
ncbi:hypothetical protein ACM7Q1_14510 [Paenibacillus illinoisensis]|uniref:hypothetical protein n=1 Tax=Paenibacillus illinoisensis TaxID=59845 RepID=UPI003A4DB5C2